MWKLDGEMFDKTSATFLEVKSELFLHFGYVDRPERRALPLKGKIGNINRILLTFLFFGLILYKMIKHILKNNRTRLVVGRNIIPNTFGRLFYAGNLDSC